MSTTRDRILRAAAPMLVRNRGASMQLIADASRVSRATVTRLFPTREDLLSALAGRLLAEARTVLDAAELATADVSDALGSLARGYEPLAQVWGVLSVEPHLVGQQPLIAEGHQLVERLDKFFARGQHENLIRADLSPQWMTFTFLGLSETAWYLVLDGRMGPRQAPEFIITTLLCGVTAKRV